MTVSWIPRVGALALVCAVTSAVAAEEQPLIMFDFEGGNLQEWTIPDWTRQTEDHVGKILSTSSEVFSHGHESLQLLADFPGTKWTAAYIEVFMYVNDWTPYSALAADVYLPPSAPAGLQARLILTIGEKWAWTEMNRGISLEPGKWTTITANLKPGSMDWKFFPSERFRTDIRKVGMRIESNRKPVYAGPIYVDAVRLLP